MATFKAVVLSHQKRRDGTYNVKIRVTHNRKHKYLPTSLYVGKDDITKSRKIKNYLVLDATEAIIKDFRTKCNTLATALDTYSVERLCEVLKRETQEQWQVNLFEFAEKVVKKKTAAGTRAIYRVSLNWVRKYAGEDVYLSDITTSFLLDLISFLEREAGKTAASSRQGASVVKSVISNLKTIYREAQIYYNEEELGIVRLPFNPFAKIEIKDTAPAKKRAISVEALRAIAAIEDEGRTCSSRDVARDFFILSFGLVGANAADMYEWTAGQYKDGRITYKRKKTRGKRADEALISIKVQPEILPLMEKYRDPKGELVFNFARRYGAIGTLHTIINKTLKRIGAIIGEPNLTFYAARHTWATIALNDAGVDKYTVHEGLNHAGGSMAITDVYIKKDWTRLDKANRAVLDFVQLPPIGGAKEKPTPEETEEG